MFNNKDKRRLDDWIIKSLKLRDKTIVRTTGILFLAIKELLFFTIVILFSILAFFFGSWVRRKEDVRRTKETVSRIRMYH